jgi:hypothetical protein
MLASFFSSNGPERGAPVASGVQFGDDPGDNFKCQPSPISAQATALDVSGKLSGS